MKRKDVDRVDDHDFPVSSPAIKIRRLDVELPTISEDEESKWSFPVTGGMEAEDSLVVDAPAVNEERAIVVFRPLNEHLLHRCSPSSFSVSVDSELISSFKSQFPWSNRSSGGDLLVDEAAEDDWDGSNGKCMAVVPWVPSQFHPAPGVKIIDSEVVMETENVGGEGPMEVEVCNLHPNVICERVDQHQGGYDGGFHSWQQQECMNQFPIQRLLPSCGIDDQVYSLTD